MINLLQVDKSGRDIFEKDYSIVLIVNNKEFYGINLSQKIKDLVLHEYNSGNLLDKRHDNKRYRMRLRVRFHTTLIILLIKEFLRINKEAHSQEIAIEICNDFDGHFHEIKYMLYRYLSNMFDKIKLENILQVKFGKPSLIDKIAIEFRTNSESVKNYHQLKINLDELLDILRK